MDHRQHHHLHHYQHHYPHPFQSHHHHHPTSDRHRIPKREPSPPPSLPPRFNQSTTPSQFSRPSLPPISYLQKGNASNSSSTSDSRIPRLPHRPPPQPVPHSRSHVSRQVSSPHLSTIHLTPSSSSRLVSPTSRASDLAIYAMMKDEKPVIDSDGVARSCSPALSESSIRRPLAAPSSAASESPVSRHSPLTIDVELSRKRKTYDREDGMTTPDTPQSFISTTLVTPQLVPTEPASKRRVSIIESLYLNDRDVSPREAKTAPFLPTKGDLPFSWNKTPQHSAYDLANFPIPPQQPITVFPVQYNFPSGAAPTINSATGNGVAATQGNGNGTTPSGSNGTDNRVIIDPALSSLRSSVGNGSAPGSDTVADAVGFAPEIRFADETLASATASPARDGLDRQQEGGASSLTNQDSGSGGALLAPPESSDGIKKEQPFSRSPELRVSHKLAERKRRKEMKELFDELREELPADRGMKASKWEILSKAIDFVRHMKSQQVDMHREIEHLRRELDIARGGTGAYPPSYPTYNLAGASYPSSGTTYTTTATGTNTALPTPTPVQGQVQQQVGQTPAVQQQQQQQPVQSIAPTQAGH
ncbi:hypothetical protein IAR55_006561 [Kwoniella newhampshirensis]|uniref:BHLH domain-containing protein n=1 Tax=Kwoniella newhampshirensis TaxID=1651941 RepID=A0AAW0YU44_9TREE